MGGRDMRARDESGGALCHGIVFIYYIFGWSVCNLERNLLFVIIIDENF